MFIPVAVGEGINELQWGLSITMDTLRIKSFHAGMLSWAASSCFNIQGGGVKEECCKTKWKQISTN